MKDEIDRSAPAFPPNAGWRDDDPACRGATLWDYFAAAALTGCCADDSERNYSAADIADEAARMADCLMVQRAKRLP